MSFLVLATLVATQSALCEAHNDIKKHVNVLKYEKDVGLRIDAIRSLRESGSKDIIPVLMNLIKNESDQAVRRKAVWALGGVKRDKDSVIPHLVDLLEDADPDIAKQAISALVSIGPESIPMLVGRIKESGKKHKERAVWALGLFGTKRKGVIDGLCSALQDKQTEVREEAARTLDGFGTSAKEALCCLVASFKDHSQLVRVHAASCVRKIDRGNKDVFGVLSESLKAKNVVVRLVALDAIRDFGRAAKSALPSIIMNLEDPQTQLSAVIVLEQIGTDAQEALPILRKLRREVKDEYLRDCIRDAVEAISRK